MSMKGEINKYAKLVQEVHPLLGLLDDCVDVGFPLQVLGDCGSQKPEGFHSQHSTVEYGDGGQCWGAPPKVHCHLHGFNAYSVLGCCDRTTGPAVQLPAYMQTHHHG